VHVSHHAVSFLAGFRNLTVQGRCYQIFVLIDLSSFFAEKVLVLLAVAGLPAPRRVATTPTRHSPASLTPPSP
jgi:hypothetical protein